MSDIQAHNYQQAYASLDHSSNMDLASFIRELAGSDGSLRTYSSLQGVEVSPLHADAEPGAGPRPDELVERAGLAR